MAPHIPGSVDAQLLGLYLSDHLSGSTAGVARSERMAKAYADTPVAAELARFSTALVREQKLLRGLMDELGVRERPHRQAAAWLLERLGRLKSNGRLVRQSPLTMVMEAELMRAAVLGKLGGWQTLEELAPDLGLQPATFAALAADARSQIEDLTRVHEHARRTAFRVHRDTGA